MKTVIGFDSLAASVYIFEDLEAAGMPADVELILVSATDMGAYQADAEKDIAAILDPKEGTWQKEISEHERNHLKRMLDNFHRVADEKETELTVEADAAVAIVKEKFPQANVRHSIVRESPGTAILAAAEASGADLIVVGSQNASKLSRFFLGSVSQHVVNHSDTSVRISRAHAKRGKETLRVIIGFDGSADSQIAVDAVANRSWPAGTEVRVVTVAEEKSVGFFLSSLRKGMWGGAESMPGAVKQGTSDVVGSLAEAAALRLSNAGITAEAIKLDGDPKDALIEMAAEWNADAIFIGAHGHRARHGDLLGAVARVLATRADCSVEIVRG